MAADAPPTPTTTLRVLTLNCWGLLGVSKHRAARFEAIGRALAATDADVACLQEVWVRADAARLAALAAAGGRLTHTHHFRCGPFGAGLVTLSAHPITVARFTRFAAAGDPLALAQGDAVAGKGVGAVRLALPCGAAVDVFNTHLSAAYSDAHGGPVERAKGGPATAITTTSTSGNGAAPSPSRPPFISPRDFNGGVRLAQMLQVADFVRACVPVSWNACFLFPVRRRARARARAAQPPLSIPHHLSVSAHPLSQGSAAAILAGDFNAPPTSLELALLASLLPPGSTDAWAAASAGGAREGGEGFTANVPGGSYTTTGAGKRAARLDYLWAIGPGTVPVAARVAMHLDPTSGRSFSDHAGVAAAFEVRKKDGEAAASPGAAAAAAAGAPPATPPSAGGGWRAGVGLFGSGRSGSGSRRRGGTPPPAAAPPAPVAHAAQPPSSHPSPLAAAVPIIEATAVRMRVAADGAGAGAAVAALVAAAALAILVGAAAAGPARFPLPSAAAIPLLALLAAAALAVPCLFIAGYADRHAQAAALAAAGVEARLRLEGVKGWVGAGGAAAPPPKPAAAVARPAPPPPPPQEQQQQEQRVPEYSYA